MANNVKEVVEFTYDAHYRISHFNFCLLKMQIHEGGNEELKKYFEEMVNNGQAVFYRE